MNTASATERFIYLHGESHARIIFILILSYCYAELAISSLAVAAAITSTYYAYP